MKPVRDHDGEATPPSAILAPRSRLARLVVIFFGILLGQSILYGPSLLGSKILLPLDCLAEQGVYIPNIDGLGTPSRNPYLSDLIYVFEPMRRIAVSEIRAGRIPMWIPNEFCGAPYIEPKFSPFQLIQFCSRSPLCLAWSQFAVALVAGFGAYAFFRRVAAVGFWPAAICAWCYPLTAFFVFWLGFPIIYPVAWLPWVLLMVWNVVRGNPISPALLSLGTGLVVVSGHLDMAGQVLLTSGIFAAWSLTVLRPKQFVWRFFARKVSILAVAWAIGLFLAAPFTLPVLEYSSSGARMQKRSSGKQERPPVGLSALPQTVLPDMYGHCGTYVRGSFRVVNDGNQMESSAGAYAGLLATLVLAPLGLCSRRHRALTGFMICAWVFSLGWSLNLPGIVHLLRLPGLNMMSHNRLVFVCPLAILTMASVGLEVLIHDRLKFRLWLAVFPLLLTGLALWCGFRAFVPPEPVATQLEKVVRAGPDMGWEQGVDTGWVRDIADVREVQRWFSRHYLKAVGWCIAGLSLWSFIWCGRSQARLVCMAAILMIGELLFFSFGRNAQCEPALYYPEIEPLKELGQRTAGRVIGNSCLPAVLAATCGLRDARGYDAVDPERIVEVLMTCSNTNLSHEWDYAATQWLSPNWELGPDGILHLPPLLDMLDVRYLVFRGSPPPDIKPVVRGTDYWALENLSAVGRVFVPRRVEVAAEKSERLKKLTASGFKPKEVAYVEVPVQVPELCNGSAQVVGETPTHITIEANMQTPGMVVLTDRWDPGWKASIDGKMIPVLITSHALRGVLLPAGLSKVEFRYAPVAFVRGLFLAALGFLALLCCIIWGGVNSSRGSGSKTSLL